MTPDELIREIRAFSPDVSETVEAASVLGQFDLASFRHWSSLASEVTQFGIELRLNDTSGEPLDEPAFSGDASVRIPGRIVIGKPNSPLVYHFLTIDGLTVFLDDRSRDYEPVTVYTAEQSSEFASLSTVFRPWRDATTEMFPAADTGGLDPAKFVRDLTRDKVVPRAVRPWLMRTRPELYDEIWTIWKLRAAYSVALSLATEVEDTADAIRLIFKSPRSTGVLLNTILGQPQEESEFFAADGLAQWVFIDGKDVETRHILMSAALAQEFVDDELWQGNIGKHAASALEVAKGGYALGLAETGNEAVKALADLRKSLYDEIPKSLQQSRELAGGLWRDFAIAAAAIIARLTLPTTTNANTTGIYSDGLFVVAGYVLFSGAINIVLNWRFRRIESAARSAWLSRLYKFLGKTEKDELAQTPLSRAANVYNLTTCIVGGFYVLTATGVFAVGWQSTHPSAVNARPSVTPPINQPANCAKRPR